MINPTHTRETLLCSMFCADKLSSKHTHELMLIDPHERIPNSSVVESYHHMAVTLPLAISRMEGSHERPRGSV